MTTINQISLSVCLLLASALYALEQEPKVMIVPQRVEKPYVTGELVCVDSKNGETECGKVTSVGTDVVHISLEPTSDGIEFTDGTVVKTAPPTKAVELPKRRAKKREKKTDELPVLEKPAEIAKPEPITPLSPTAPSVEGCGRALASTALYQEPSVQLRQSELSKDGKSALSFFGSFGMDHYVVGPEFQRVFSKEVAGSVAPFFSAGGSSVTSVYTYGAYVRLLYFPVKERDDFYVAPGLGLFSIHSNVKKSDKNYSLTALSLSASGGYRFSFEGNYFVSLELGVQHLFPVSGNDRKVNFSGLQPVTFIQLGMTLF